MPTISTRDLWQAYRHCSCGTRLHTLVRSVLCPMTLIAGYAPTSGQCLDVGCGHGLLVYYLAATSPHRQILGIDPSARKIAEACKATLPSDRVRFTYQTVAEVQETGFDFISLVDVLYLLPDEEERGLLCWCHERLAPSGLLLIKDVMDHPRVKFWLTYLEETLAVKALGITYGQDLFFRSPAKLVQEMTAAGFRTEVQPVGRWYLHPHVLYLCRKVAD